MREFWPRLWSIIRVMAPRNMEGTGPLHHAFLFLTPGLFLPGYLLRFGFDRRIRQLLLLLPIPLALFVYAIIQYRDTDEGFLPLYAFALMSVINVSLIYDVLSLSLRPSALEKAAALFVLGGALAVNYGLLFYTYAESFQLDRWETHSWAAKLYFLNRESWMREQRNIMLFFNPWGTDTSRIGRALVNRFPPRSAIRFSTRCWTAPTDDQWQPNDCAELDGPSGDRQLLHELFFHGIRAPGAIRDDSAQFRNLEFETVYLIKVKIGLGNEERYKVTSRRLHQSLKKVMESFPGYRLRYVVPHDYWPLENDLDWSFYTAVVCRQIPIDK
jgi:hypothetical protein